jgi:hypothetical protein
MRSMYELLNRGMRMHAVGTQHWKLNPFLRRVLPMGH